MDETLNKIILSTEKPHFVDENEKNALLSTKTPHFVDESETRRIIIQKRLRGWAESGVSRRGKPLARILPE